MSEIWERYEPTFGNFEDSMGFGGFLGFSVRKISHLGVRTFRTGTGRFRADDAYVRKDDAISYILSPQPPSTISHLKVLM